MGVLRVKNMEVILQDGKGKPLPLVIALLKESGRGGREGSLPHSTTINYNTIRGDYVGAYTQMGLAQRQRQKQDFRLYFLLFCITAGIVIFLLNTTKTSISKKTVGMSCNPSPLR